MKINSPNPFSILSRDSLQLFKASCLEVTYIPHQSICISLIAYIKVQCIKTFRYSAQPINKEHCLCNMTLLTAEENKIKFKSIKGKELEYECYKTLKSF